MIEIEPVTLSEAQFLTGRPEKEINAAIDRGEIEKITEKVRVPIAIKTKNKRPTRSGRGIRRGRQRIMGYAPPPTREAIVRKVGAPELLFLALARELQADLTPAGRKRLYEAIKAQGADPRAVELGPFRADVAKTTKALVAGFKRLRALRRGIIEQPGQDPVIKGTEISAYRVAALAQGQTINEILLDYSGLQAEQVQRAIDYSAAYPKPGRPYPAHSFKRAASALAEAGVFDFPSEAAEG